MIETAAAKYRRLKEQSIDGLIYAPITDGTPLYDVQSPTGMTWKCRRADIAAFVNAGALPMSFAQKMLESLKAAKGDAQEAFNTLSAEEQVRALAITSMLIRYVVVEPRIVDTPRDDSEIAFDEVLMADYQCLANWATSGGGEADGLNNFRSK